MRLVCHGSVKAFARIANTLAGLNPTAGPSFCFASYREAIPDLRNILASLCFPARATRRTRNIRLGPRFILGL